MKSILKITNLKKIYHDKKGEITAVKDFSLDIKKGEFIAIVGPSGCGKSTILSVLCGLEKQSKGEINYMGNHDLKIGYMFQDDSLFDWRNVIDNCLIGPEITHSLNDEVKVKVNNMLETYGLKDFIFRYPKGLSGGMRKRVALIRTLSNNPDILLLDEPFNGLDYQLRLAVSDDIYNIIKKEQKTAIMVTHDLAEAISMADRIVVLSKRPSVIKNIYNINLTNKASPIENRTAKEFSSYYDLIWKDLDIHV